MEGTDRSRTQRVQHAQAQRAADVDRAPTAGAMTPGQARSRRGHGVIRHGEEDERVLKGGGRQFEVLAARDEGHAVARGPERAGEAAAEVAPAGDD